MTSEKYLYKPYDPQYQELFQREKGSIRHVLGERVNIDHFGSSSIPNIGGKGYIDIYVTAEEPEIRKVSKKIQKKLNYSLKTDSGDEDRWFFLKEKTDKKGNKINFHLHLSDKNSPNYQQVINFRDYLKAHPEEAKEYNNVKIRASELAMKHKTYGDQKRIYQQSKRKIIEEINNKSVVWKRNKGKF